MQFPDIFGIRKLTQQVSELNNVVALQEKGMTPLSRQFTNFNTQIFPHYNILKEEFIMQTMDDIYSIVSRLAATAAGIPSKACLPDGSLAGKKDKLNAFLSTLTFEEKEKFYTTLYLMGECFAYIQKIDYGVNAGVQRIDYLLPSNMVVIISETFPTEIVGYRYYDSFNGYTKDFALDEIFFIKMFNPTRDIQKRFRGLSPTTALRNRLVRVQSELDVSVAQMQNGGLPGVMYDKAPGAREVGASGQRKSNFAAFLNNTDNKGAPYMADGDIGYFHIGSVLADMQLAELADIDFDKCCNAFSVSSTLFNSKKASTESNVKEMRKDMLTNAILPQVKRFNDGLNQQVVIDIPTTAVIDYDVSSYSELKDDIEKIGRAWSYAPVVRPNDVLVSMGEDASDDPLMDKYYIKTGYTPIEDMAIPDVIPNAAGDYVPPTPPAKKSMDDEIECPNCKTKNKNHPSGMITCKGCKKSYLAIQ